MIYALIETEEGPVMIDPAASIRGHLPMVDHRLIGKTLVRRRYRRHVAYTGPAAFA